MNIEEWAPGDLNPEPTDYESGALTVELGARDCEKAVRNYLKIPCYPRKKPKPLTSVIPLGERREFRNI